MSKYKITAPVPVTGTGWGLSFVEGKAETDNEALAKKLSGKGYTVEAETSTGAFICPVCGKEYKAEKGLKDHMKKEHPDYKSEDPGQGQSSDEDPGQGQE